MTEEEKTLLIVDGYGFIFRAYYVQPPLTSPHGLPVGAIYGFTSMLLKLLNDFKPQHAVVVFDAKGKNFRHELYPLYKANRPPAPEELISQFAGVRTAAQCLNFPILEKTGFEADDLIATLACRAAAIKENSIIVSCDKDLMQLINGYIKMYDPVKSKYITNEDVEKKFGVGPDKVREVMALMGDSSDNIPGVPSIGPKTAASLIRQFGNVQELLASIDKLKNVRQKEIIIANKDNALISWQLVGLDHNVDLNFDLDSLRWSPPDHDKIVNFLTEYGFKTLYKRAEHLFQLEIKTNPAPFSETLIDEKFKPVSEITNSEQLGNILTKAVEKGIIAVHLIEHNHVPVALALATSTNPYYIALSPSVPDLSAQNHYSDLFNYSQKGQGAPWFWPQLIKLLQDKAVKKITINLKNLLKFCYNNYAATNITACEDLELMQYLLSAGLPQKDFFSIAEKSKGIAELITESSQIVTTFINEYHRLAKSLKEEKILHLYKDIDLPLCYVLHKVETIGLKIDLPYLKQLSTELGEGIANLEEEIYTMSGTKFNIASPKQLGEVLFEKMQLPFTKLSGKTKAYSTRGRVLLTLSEQGYPIADLLLKWRQLTKLKTTYTDALPLHINPETGRVHSTFLQTSTTTGRLSSQEPNLQNIPIRSEEGNNIRKAFVAAEGCRLISADYSQIELRILSHIADVSTLKEAFLEGEDIHTQTACKIFKISREEITPARRYKAKAINFGIIYGISPFGLAKQLKLSVKEASDYIAQYFEEFPGIKEYMERTKAFAREYGYVKNLFGRKCFVPLIHDKNAALRQFAERAAINAPIQGANADIIKIAMINIDKKISRHNFKTKLISQIHDELLFEAPLDEVEAIVLIIRTTMENSCPLKVPTKVEVHTGSNWMKIH